MAVYYGVVKNNQVVLEGDVRLADGVRVEVRPVERATAPAEASVPDVVVVDTAEAEEALLRDLLAEGLLEEPPIDEAAPDEPFKLRVFVDRGIVEVFVNGRQCVAMRVHPGRADSLGVSLLSQGQEAELKSLTAWPMKGIFGEGNLVP